MRIAVSGIDRDVTAAKVKELRFSRPSMKTRPTAKSQRAGYTNYSKGMSSYYRSKTFVFSATVIDPSPDSEKYSIIMNGM